MDEGWFLQDRNRIDETDPSKIPILIPEEWCQDASALRRYFDRVQRQKEMENSQKSIRAPKLGLTRETSPFQVPTNNFSSSASANQEHANSEPEYEILPEPDSAKYSDPQSHGNMSFDITKHRK